ncbi:MAG: GNAT family N-acetyltransferase [Actinomycetota bacterium]
MSEVTVRPLGGDDWQIYQELRLRALQDDPDAFVSSYEEEKSDDEPMWRQRMSRSTRLVADQGGRLVGVVSVGRASEEEIIELFGLWVEAQQRGEGVAMKLTQAAAMQALKDGKRAIKLWVATDNGRAVAFFSSAGFRPTDERRPVAKAPGGEELAMVLPVGEDRHFAEG